MIIIGKFLRIMEDLYISKHACIYLSMFDKMLVPWRGLQLLLYLGDVPLELFAPLITICFILPLLNQEQICEQ